MRDALIKDTFAIDINLFNHLTKSIMELKKLKFSIVLIATAVLLPITACTSDNDILYSEPTPISISADDINNTDANVEREPNTIKITFSENGESYYEIPMIILSEEDFQREMQNKIFKTPQSDKSKTINEPVLITKASNGYNVTLYNGILEVRYSTSYPYEFPSNPNVYTMYYKFSTGEFPGSSRGKVNGNQLTASLDIVRKTGDRKYEYAYSVVLEAYIQNKTIRVY